MRVSTQALASLAALSFFASCVTPPPLARSDGSYARYDTPPARYESTPAPSEVRLAPYREASYAPPPGGQGSYDRSQYDRDGYYRGDQAGPNRAPETYPGEYRPAAQGRLSVLLGRRNLDDPSFEPTDEPGIVAIEFSQVPAPGTLGFEFGLAFGYDKDNDVFVPGAGLNDLEVSQAEIYAGVRAEFGQSNVRPYIGGGGTFMSTTTTVTQGFSEFEEDDNALGLYIHGGIQVDLNEAFYLGIDYRHVFGADYDVNGTEVDSDYDQLAFVLGFNL